MEGFERYGLISSVTVLPEANRFSCAAGFLHAGLGIRNDGKTNGIALFHRYHRTEVMLYLRKGLLLVIEPSEATPAQSDFSCWVRTLCGGCVLVKTFASVPAASLESRIPE